MILNVKKKFYKEVVNALELGKVSLFVGAGVSRSSGYLDWKELLRRFAEELGLDINKENDLILLAQYYKNENGGTKSSFNQELINTFTKNVHASNLLKVIAKLPVNTYWTTNYDKLLEKELEKNGKILEVKVHNNDFVLDKPSSNATLYKFHGDIDSPYDAVLTKDDYETFSYTHQNFVNALKGDLATKTFIFIGYSFSDPDFNHILTELRIQLGGNIRNHFCFFKSLHKDDEKYLKGDDYPTFNEELFEYDKNKQQLQIRELLRFGIHTIMVEKYSDIDKILENTYLKYQMNKIFVAGKLIPDKSSHIENVTQEKLLCDIGYDLISHGFKLSTGMCEGTGIFIVNGALNAITDKSLKIEDNLTIKRLPLVNGSADHMDAKTKNNYQNNMIEDVGIVLFLYGNSMYDNKIENSRGTWHDYERAIKHQKVIIPIASTGYTSEQILNDMLKKNEEFPYIIPFIDRLKTANTSTEIIKLIEDITKEVCKLNNI